MNHRKLTKLIQDEIYLFSSIDREYPEDEELGKMIRDVIKEEMKTHNSTK